jgi:hypothetical protein
MKTPELYHVLEMCPSAALANLVHVENALIANGAGYLKDYVLSSGLLTPCWMMFALGANPELQRRLLNAGQIRQLQQMIETAHTAWRLQVGNKDLGLHCKNFIEGL